MGPCVITAILNIWIWFFLFHFFCDLAVKTHFAPIYFYKQTALRAETCIQSNFYTHLYIDILAQRNLCTDKSLHIEGFYTKKFLYTKIFTYRYFTQIFLYTRINKGTQAFLHVELFTEKYLYRIIFTQRNIYTGKFNYIKFWILLYIIIHY